MDAREELEFDCYFDQFLSQLRNNELSRMELEVIAASAMTMVANKVDLTGKITMTVFLDEMINIARSVKLKHDRRAAANIDIDLS